MENIVNAKGFINKTGEKVQMIPTNHRHTISEITELLQALDNKINKVYDPVFNNLASFDENGNITDSGKKANDFAPIGHTHDSKADKVTNATSGDFALLDSNGNLVDSNKKPNDFASSDHTHDTKADKVFDATSGNLACLDDNGNLADSGRKTSDFAEFSTTSRDEGYLAAVDPNGQNIIFPTSVNPNNIARLYIESSISGLDQMKYNMPMEGKVVFVRIDTGDEAGLYQYIVKKINNLPLTTLLILVGYNCYYKREVTVPNLSGAFEKVSFADSSEIDSAILALNLTNKFNAKMDKANHEDWMIYRDCAPNGPACNLSIYDETSTGFTLRLSGSIAVDLFEAIVFPIPDETTIRLSRVNVLFELNIERCEIIFSSYYNSIEAEYYYQCFLLRPMAGRGVVVYKANVTNMREQYNEYGYADLIFTLDDRENVPTLNSEKLITSKGVYDALHKSVLYLQGNGQFEFTKTSNGYLFLDDPSDENEIENYMTAIETICPENVVVPVLVVIYNGGNGYGGISFLYRKTTIENEGTTSEIAHTNFEFLFGDNVINGRVSVDVNGNYSSTGLATVTKISDIFNS